MATETPMRMVESSQASKWLPSKDAAAFGSSFKSKATEELGFFLKGKKLGGDQEDFIPSRSGSAPPSIEGSVAAVGNMFSVKDRRMNSNSGSLGNACENCKAEGQCLLHPTYVAFHSSDVNLNPRLPRRNRRTQIDSSKANQAVASLSTHKGELHKEGSPGEAPENLFENSSILKPGQNAALLVSCHKSLVDLIQEDFPRTPSPVYNQSHLSSHATSEDLIDLDVNAISSTVSSMNISNLSDSTTTYTSVVETSALKIDACELILNEVPSETFPSLQHADGTKSMSEDQTCNEDARLKDDVSTNGLIHAEEHKLRAFNSEVRRHKQEEQQYYGWNKLNRSLKHGYSYQDPGAGAQVMSQGMSNSHTYLGKLAHSHAQFSASLGLKPSLLSPGSTSPLYAMPTPFMTSVNPIFSNFQPSGLFAPQYSLGGYAVSSPVFPPYVAGYSSQDVLSMPFEAAFGPNFNGQATSVLSEGIPHAGNFQYQSKCYGRNGLALQPPYIDLLNMQYYPHSFDDAYPACLQQNQLASRILTGDQISSLVSQQNSAFNAYLDGGKFQSSVNGGLTLPSSTNVGITGSSYFGNPSTMGVNVMMQYPVLSLGSSIPPSSSVGGTNFPGGQDKIMTHQVVGRSAGFCCGRRGSSYDDPKKESFVKDLQSIYSGKFELSYITGHIVEFSIDQHGSRFIQQKLETCNAEEKVSIFEEVLPHALKLITDVFGNFVIQKFFEHGSPDQRKQLANELSGQMLSLSLQMYGCRVIQKAIEVIEPDQKTQLVQQLDGHITRCVRDQNGNHVIQKCIECIPMDRIQFIISAFQGQVTTLSIHPYGCRVIQRILEHFSDEQHIQCIVDEILESAWFLTQDQYGNYVTQHVLERGKPHERSQIISKLTGKIVQLSQHKYASNVIEKCLEHGNAIEREVLIEEIIGQLGEGDNMLTMMKDQFANYVVQKVLETSNDRQREILVNHVRVHLDDLKKYTYGKHIVTRFELLTGPGSRTEVP